MKTLLTALAILSLLTQALQTSNSETASRETSTLETSTPATGVQETGTPAIGTPEIHDVPPANPSLTAHEKHADRIHALCQQLGRAIAWQQWMSPKRERPLCELRDQILEYITCDTQSSAEARKLGPSPLAASFLLELPQLESAINRQAELLRSRIQADIDSIDSQYLAVVQTVKTSELDTLSLKNREQEETQPDEIMDAIESILPQITIRQPDSLTSQERAQVADWKREQVQLRLLLQRLTSVALDAAKSAGHDQLQAEMSAWNTADVFQDPPAVQEHDQSERSVATIKATTNK